MNPMMKCGHAANSVQTLPDGTRQPSCVICIGITPGADEIDTAPPSLDRRMASCCYHGSCKARGLRVGGRSSKPDYGQYDESGHSVAPSSTDLPFFEHKPNETHDAYFCGCFGWD